MFPRIAIYSCLTFLGIVTLSSLYYYTDIDTALPLLPSALRIGSLADLETSILQDSDNRHLTASQCLQRYPELYYEADRAKVYYEFKGGITEEMLDDAERDGGHARLAIIGNNVGSFLPPAPISVCPLSLLAAG